MMTSRRSGDKRTRNREKNDKCKDGKRRKNLADDERSSKGKEEEETGSFSDEEKGGGQLSSLYRTFCQVLAQTMRVSIVLYVFPDLLFGVLYARSEVDCVHSDAIATTSPAPPAEGRTKADGRMNGRMDGNGWEKRRHLSSDGALRTRKEERGRERFGRLHGTAFSSAARQCVATSSTPATRTKDGRHRSYCYCFYYMVVST